MIKEYLKKNWWRYLIGISFLVTVDVIQIFIPKSIGSLVDTLKIENFDMLDIKNIIISIIMMALGLAVGRFFWRIFIIGGARLFEFNTINKMFSHIIKLDLNFFDKWRTGDLMTRFISDTQMLMRLMGFAVIMAIDAIVMTFITIFAMGEFVNWNLTLISIIPVPFIAITSLLFGKIIHKRFIVLQETNSELSNITEESVSGIQVIKLFSNKKVNEKLFMDKSKDFYDAQISLIKVWGLMFPIIMFLGALSTVLVFIFGGSMVIYGEISLGDFIMTNQYVGMLIWPMMAFGQVINHIQRGRASKKRIEEVLSQEKSINEPPEKNFEFENEIKIKNLEFSYPGSERKILENINMDIKKGEMIAFVGKIGSGKSTLAKVLAKLYPLGKDFITIDGKDINDINGINIRENISYVPQENFLFSATLKENILFSKDDLSEDPKVYASMANVEDDIEELPEKYETVVGERGITLSGGQRQRVTIARALAKNSSIIILDDCLSAVDTETEEKIIKSLRKETKGKTIIVISHRLKAVKEANKIFVFDDGKITEKGSHDELVNINGLYASMYQKQLIEERLGE